MKIIATDLPKYTVTFNHPDDSSRSYEIFVDLEDEQMPWSDDDWNKYHKRLVKEVWETFNHYGYWHTMTIETEWHFEGKMYKQTICEDIGWAEVDFEEEPEEDEWEDYEITAADLHDYMYGI